MFSFGDVKIWILSGRKQQRVTAKLHGYGAEYDTYIIFAAQVQSLARLGPRAPPATRMARTTTKDARFRIALPDVRMSVRKGITRDSCDRLEWCSRIPVDCVRFVPVEAKLG